MAHPVNHRGAVVAVISSGLFAAIASAGTLVVPDDQPFLGVALAQAQSGDTIMIRAGTYAEANEFTIVGKQLTIVSESADAEVIISGAGIHRALRIEGAGADGTVFEGITFTDGVAPGNGESTSGGGVLIVEANVTFRNCDFVGNVAQQAGGGLAAFDSILTVESCSFVGNEVLTNTSDGAGVFSSASNIGNDTQVFVDCLFDSNVSGDTAGGMRIDASDAQITRCTFVDNFSRVRGGAFFGRTGDLRTFDQCSFIGNATEGQGGAVSIWDSNTSSRFRNCIFEGNSAVVRGGVVEVRFSVFEAINCTMIGHTAGANAISDYFDPGVINLKNVIIHDNDPVATPFRPGGSLTVRYSLVEGGQAGEGNIDVAPMLDADLTPMPGSPVIDAGSSDLYDGPFADYAGGLRGLDDPAVPDSGEAVAGPVVDMGALERQVISTSSCPSDINGDGEVDGADLGILLGAWGVCF